MKSKLEIKNLYKEYIADSFDCEAMGIPQNSTPKEKATRFLNLIEGRHSPFEPKNVLDHIQGLGEYIDIFYMWSDIVIQAHSFGLIDSMRRSKTNQRKDKEVETSNIENKICEKYHATIASYVIQMSKAKS